MSWTDTELVKRANRGDRAAFGELVKRYQGAVYGLAYHKIRSFTEAEDIVQETFLRAYRRLSQLRDPAKFGGWLRSIALHICDNWLRQPRRLVPIEDYDAADVTALMISNGPPTPEEEYQQLQLREKVWSALKSLPDSHQETVVLYCIENRSYNEIAAFLEVPVSTVKGRLYTARKKLRKETFAIAREFFGTNKTSGDLMHHRILSFGPLAKQVMSLSEHLEKEGYHISITTDRESLLKTFPKLQPEAILLDIRDEEDLSLVKDLVALSPDTAIIPVLCWPSKNAPYDEKMLPFKLWGQAWHYGASLRFLLPPFSKDEVLQAVKSEVRCLHAKKRNSIVREAWVREHPDSLYAQYHFVCAKCGKTCETPFCHEQPMELQPFEEDDLDRMYQDYCGILREVSKKTGKSIQPLDKSEVPHLKPYSKRRHHHVCKICGATWSIPGICCGEEMELRRREGKLTFFTGLFNW